jgi:hypothetical protein
LGVRVIFIIDGGAPIESLGFSDPNDGKPHVFKPDLPQTVEGAMGIGRSTIENNPFRKLTNREIQTKCFNIWPQSSTETIDIGSLRLHFRKIDRAHV